MKDIKCPLCGNKLVKRCAYEYESTDGLTCLECGYQLLEKVDLKVIRKRNDQCLTTDDYDAAERFISKFPPIMRVQERDIIEYEETCDGDILNGRITLKTVSSRGEIMLQVVIIDEDGNDYLDFNGKPEIDTICSFQIRKWPWELEQKGGK